MSWFQGACTRLRLLLARRSAESRMESEFHFHVEMDTERRIRSGTPPAEARRQSLLAFGGIERHRESMRDGRGGRWLEDLWMDLRYAARSLRRSPGFATVAIVTLALGIGANAAIFSVVDGVLLRPLPFASPERLVAITDLGYRGELLQLREHSRTLDVEAIGVGQEFNLTGSGEPVRLEGAAVSAGAFNLLGLTAAVGRTFLADEEGPGASPAVIISHGLWQRRFAADPRIVGQQIRLDGVFREVVGVMPAGTRVPSLRTDLWVPLTIDPANAVALWSTAAGTLVGRLRPDASIEQAQAELSALAPSMRQHFPWDMPAEYGATAAVVPLREFMVGDMRGSLLILLASVGLVLLIACVNVANLLLARASFRGQETVVRTALGAGRGRLIRQHLAESAFLAMAGAAAGLAVAYVGVAILTRALPADTPRLDEVALDGRVFAFALGTALLASIAFGLLPALRLSAMSLQAGLAQGGRSAAGSSGRRRVAGSLVVAEIALAVVLVIASGLMLKGFWQLTQSDPGFRAEGVVSATVAPPDFRYGAPAARREFHDRLLERAASLPGARSAAIADRIPFGGRAYGSVFVITGRPHPARSGGDWPYADVRAAVSDDYFSTLGVRLVRGRTFGPADRAGAPAVAMVGRALAAQYWPGAEAIGARVSFPGDSVSYEIVGIVDDVKWEEVAQAGGAALYLSLRQAPGDGAVSLLVRTDEPSRAAGQVRAMVTAVDDATPVSNVQAMEALLSQSMQQPRVNALLLALFAALALVLGAVGIYGVIAYAVSQRTREFGVRLALGASPFAVTRQITLEGLGLGALGVMIGVVGALGLTQALSSQLHGVSARDPMVYAGATALLALVTLFASWLPARRAARVDPATALRCS